jgi:hypothetical protein
MCLVIRNNRAAWQRGCLQATQTSNRTIFVTSYRPGNYFHLMFIFKLKWKTNIIGQNMQQMTSQLHRKQYCFQVSICHMLKIDLKTLEHDVYSMLALAFPKPD